MERQIEHNCKNGNVECIWGYTDSYHNTSGLFQKDCNWACSLCHQRTIGDSATGPVSAPTSIVTLRKEKEIFCITQHVTVATFISPPFIENSTKSLSLLTGEDWSCDNWILTDGSNSLSGSVTDKRWENFEVIQTNNKTFTSVQTVSFSLHSPLDLQLWLIDKQKFFNVHLRELKEGWNHIYISLRNNSILYFLNNKQINLLNGFNPHQIIVQSTNVTFWKIHDYQFMMSENVTDGKPTTLTLPHTETSCFLLYVSLCETCVLTIPELNRNYNSANYPSFLNSWQVYHTEIETGIENLSFYKTTTDNSTIGYWGIDLHQCPTNDTVSHKVSASETEEHNYLCYVLKDEYRIERQMEQKKRNMNIESCKDQSCKCIWGYTDSYNTTELVHRHCKWECNLCNEITNKDLTRGKLLLFSE
jgi:hypothetical protein